jgi:hypothetical protein
MKSAWITSRLLAGALISGQALAHGNTSHAPGKHRAISTEEHPWGREGDPRRATLPGHFEAGMIGKIIVR